MKANKKENKACIKVGKKEDPRTEGTGKKGEKGGGGRREKEGYTQTPCQLGYIAS